MRLRELLALRERSFNDNDSRSVSPYRGVVMAVHDRAEMTHLIQHIRIFLSIAHGRLSTPKPRSGSCFSTANPEDTRRALPPIRGIEIHGNQSCQGGNAGSRCKPLHRRAVACGDPIPILRNRYTNTMAREGVRTLAKKGSLSSAMSGKCRTVATPGNRLQAFRRTPECRR